MRHAILIFVLFASACGKADSEKAVAIDWQPTWIREMEEPIAEVENKYSNSGKKLMWDWDIPLNLTLELEVDKANSETRVVFSGCNADVLIYSGIKKLEYKKVIERPASVCFTDVKLETGELLKAEVSTESVAADVLQGLMKELSSVELLENGPTLVFKKASGRKLAIFAAVEVAE